MDNRKLVDKFILLKKIISIITLVITIYIIFGYFYFESEDIEKIPYSNPLIVIGLILFIIVYIMQYFLKKRLKKS